MHTLVQSARLRESTGDPLPDVWEALGEMGARFQRGQLALIAAGPGTGKSAFILNYALKSKVSCLYFSADSDAYIQLSRSLAILGGFNMVTADRVAKTSTPQQLADIVSDAPIRFSYNTAPTLAHIEAQLLAYNELHGDFPELVVIDNALDVQLASPANTQTESLDMLMAWLHDMARITQSCVAVLHHVTGPHNDGNQPIPLSGVKGQIGRVPEFIVTLHKLGSVLNVSVVKNRGHQADASGKTFVPLMFTGSTMSIESYPSIGDTDPFDYVEEEEVEEWMG